jgi:hypothetical protein
LELRTYTGQRGVDRRRQAGNPDAVLIGPDYGNFDNARMEMDYTDEKTYIYAGGLGEGAARVIGTASDAVRIGASPFGRREYFKDSRHSTTLADANDEADSELRERRLKVSLTGSIIETPNVRYGINFSFGDLLTVEFNGQLFDARVSVVHARFQERREALDARIRYES